MKIPIRNIWWLLLYSSEYTESNYSSMVGFEELPEDIPDLIGQILTKSVESRLRRQLSFSFEKKEEVINRIRGKINHVITARNALLSKGKIFCTFDELTINNLRNRYVKAALIKISRIIKDPALRKKCISLANFLTIKGVSSIVPKFKELKSERFGRNDICDKEMISAAKLAMDLCLQMREMVIMKYRIQKNVIIGFERYSRRLLETSIFFIFSRSSGKFQKVKD